MKKSILMKLLMAVSVSLLAVGVTSCREDKGDDDTPKVEIRHGSGDYATSATVTVPAGGEDLTITVNSTYEWKIDESGIPADVTVDPKTAKKGETTVTVKVGANEEGRDIKIKFYLVEYTSFSATLTVKQENASVASIVYYEDCGENVEQNIPGESDPTQMFWPYIDQYDGWNPVSRIDGLSQSQVEYSSPSASRASVRKRDDGNTTLSKGPHVFMNSQNSRTVEFVISDINITGYDKFIFSMYGVAYDGTANVAKTAAGIQMYASYNGEEWAPLTSNFDSETGWSPVTSEFSVASGSASLYLKIVASSAVANQNRFDDFTLTAGGNGALIQPEEKPDAVQKTLTEIRNMAQGAITENYYFKASIISDFSDKGGNATSLKNLIVSDGTSGIMVRVSADPATGDFNVGEEVEVYAMGATLGEYQGLLQLSGVANTDVKKTGNTKAIAYAEITPTQLLTGNYESMLVAVKDVQFDIEFVGQPLAGSSHTSSKMADAAGNEFMVFVSSYATFKATVIPENSGTMKGIASVNNDVYQVLPQTAADLSGLNQPRFGGSDKYFRVTAGGSLNVSATTASVSFNLTGNVNWTASVTSGTGATVSPASGDGAATPVVTFGENSSTTLDRVWTVKFSTTDTDVPETDREYTFTITQAAASGGGGLPAGTVIYKETWGSEGTASGLLLAEYGKTGTITYESGDKSGITYSSAGGATLYAKVYDTGQVAGSSGYANASGDSQLLIPKSARGEVISVSGIQLYDAGAIDFSMAYRRTSAADVTIKYEFSNGQTGTFTSNGSESGNDNWVNYTFDTVTVPTGASSLKISIEAAVDYNIRADDIIIKVAN